MRFGLLVGRAIAKILVRIKQIVKKKRLIKIESLTSKHLFLEFIISKEILEQSLKLKPF
jgi:hypothetical protein